MELEVAIKHWKNNLDKWKKDRPDLSNTEIVEEIDYDYKAIETLLNHITKQEKMIENAKDRIEYYLMGNSTLNDFNVREKELEKLLKILNKVEESE